ncbi:hypothetical protein PIROE2DRAFT_13507 [Piromyces sp. E2]|nr:hypothetical protein PIROE2DRAFT_13507 [Piromyces sp. E2]|eukprot:OUM60687.1 hypothetical protein PIROE2DRAFT_13507 [Piromyces sp. E2]
MNDIITIGENYTDVHYDIASEKRGRKDWKRPVILILILYWFLQCTGDHFQNYLYFSDIEKYREEGYEWPFNKYNWLVVNSIAHLFWESGEIIADWYPLLRTKAIVQEKKKLKPIYLTCILFNIIKSGLILSNFIFVPSTFKIPDSKVNLELMKYKIIWWSIVFAIQIVNLSYDISVIIALKKSLFNKLESFKNKSNSFLDKFKQVSELLVKDITDPVEYIRIIGLRFIYTFMYIDQILLRFYIKKSKTSYKTNSTSVDSELLITPPASTEPSSTAYNSNFTISTNSGYSVNTINNSGYSANTINNSGYSANTINNNNFNYNSGNSLSPFRNTYSLEQDVMKPSNNFEMNFIHPSELNPNFINNTSSNYISHSNSTNLLINNDEYNSNYYLRNLKGLKTYNNGVNYINYK